MNLLRFGVLPLVLIGCSDTEFNFETIPPDLPPENTIRGQVCDEETQTWLEGATVYTLLYDQDGVVFDTVTDLTDAEGRWELSGLPSGQPYEVYVAYRNDLLDILQVELPEGGDVDLPTPSCFGDVAAKVAVVSGAYDDLSSLFAVIGIAGYYEVDGQDSLELSDFLANGDNLAEFQVIFFDGGHQEYGVVYPATDPVVAQNVETLRTYVQNGGIIFSSDWSYDLVEAVWPNQIDFLNDDALPDVAQSGEPADLTATVVDASMSSGVGFNQVDLSFDLSEYPVISDVDPSTRVYVEANVPYRFGQTVYTVLDSPLAVSFSDGAGTVYFTTWRAAANGAGDPLAVVQFLVSEMNLAESGTTTTTTTATTP